MSAILATSMLTCTFAGEAVHAEPETEAPSETAAQTIDGEPVGANDGIKVNENGSEKDFDTDAEWEEDDITGSDEPTIKVSSSSAEVVSASEENLYTLTIATGMQDGSSVEYIVVRYNDANGAAQSKYIFPKTHSLQASYDYVKDKYKSSEEDKQRDNVLSGLGYEKKSPEAPKALSSWSIDEYLFTTESEISSVNGMEAFMSNGSWTIQGMTVSKVTAIDGFGEYGFFSGKYFYNFQKTRICEFYSKKNGANTIPAKGDNLINVGGSNSIYFGLRSVKDDPNKENWPKRSEYTFRMDLADTLEGGLETLLRTDPSDSSPSLGPIAEDIAVELEYKDINGWTRNVTLPVLLSVIGQYSYDRQNNKDLSPVRTTGLAQRGDTLAFNGYLPDFESLISTKIFVGESARNALYESGGFKWTRQNQTALGGKLDYDPISISGVSIYKGKCIMSNTPDGKSSSGDILPSYSYTFDYESKDPMMYFTTTKQDGVKINPGTSDSFNLEPYKSGSPLIGAQNNTEYMLRLKTDDIKGAETSGNIKAKINYRNVSGDKLSTPIYDVKNEVLNYLGYWPTSEDNNANFGYINAVKPGNFVEFPVTLDGLSTITGVEISLDGAASSEDEWQLKSISLTIVDNLSKVRVYGQQLDAGGESSGYRIIRAMERTVIPPFPIDLKKHKLFASGDSYLFSTETGSSTSTGGVNYNDLRYSMTYEQTQYNLGFVKRLKTYDVTVKVADDSTSKNVNGDAGSKNQFYFQLEFKNGKSGFVLANQQLTADGFRSGQKENFAVSVNRDYNDLKRVRIIPEDLSSDSDVFDKLNIENITVTERTTGGSAVQYIIDKVGWIDIDYHDSAAQGSIKGQEGRTLEAISHKFNVSSKKNVINLLCEVSTEPWDTDFLQVHGSIACDLRYIDTSGQPQTISFDVVERMADYMKKTPKTYEAASDGSNQALYNNMGALSDPDWMLRPNHTDRFILPPLADVESIKGMTLYAVSRNNKPAKWVISGISISRIISDSGTVELTKNEEYYRKMQTESLCQMVMDSKQVELYLPAGSPEPLEVEFSDNMIEWSENAAWISSVTRLPDSENDTLDIYIYPEATSRDIADVNASVAVQYTLPFSQVMQAKESTLQTLNSGTEDAVFVCKGLSVNGMQNLCEMGLRCRNSSILFNHAIVQQIRDDVVVKTYDFNFGDASALLGLSAKPKDSTVVHEPKKQVLMLSFGTETEDITLFPEQNDIAVSLKYRSTIDDGEYEFYTPYVYFTDVGIERLTKGLMAEIPIETSYVGEITGYRIVSFGNIKANIEGALAINYDYKEKKTDEKTGEVVYSGEKRESCTSFDESFTLKNAIIELDATAKGMKGEGSLTPLDLIINTGSAVEGKESGTDTAVRMTFAYTNHSGTVIEPPFTVNDIRNYIQPNKKKSDSDDTATNDPYDKKFVTGQSARIRMFLKDCDQLISMSILPYNDRGTASWLVSDINGSICLGDEPFNRVLNKEISQTKGEEKIILKDIGLETIVSANNSSIKVMDHSMSLVLESGKKATFTVILNNSKMNFDAQAVWLINGTETSVPGTLVRTSNKAVTFTAPENDTSAPQTYAITISSIENPTVKDIINITVPTRSVITNPNPMNDQNRNAVTTQTLVTAPVQQETNVQDEEQNNDPANAN